MSKSICFSSFHNLIILFIYFYPECYGICKRSVVDPAFHSCLSTALTTSTSGPAPYMFNIFCAPPHPNKLRSLHRHKHSSSIVLIIAAVTATPSLAVLSFVSSTVEEPIQQQGNLTDSINSVAAQQPMRNTESVCLPFLILGH